MPFHNTNVRYRNGLINLRDFPKTELIKSEGNKEVYKVPNNIEFLTVWNGNEKWLPVESFSIHKNMKIIEVKTNTSRTIHVSDDHSLVTVDEELNYKRATAQRF